MQKYFDMNRTKIIGKHNKIKDRQQECLNTETRLKCIYNN